jgi:hypothetical protein
MSDTDAEIARLGRLMAAAVADEDFEAAAGLKAEIGQLAGVDPARGRGSMIRRGSPGAMGLGTDQVTPGRPKGWRAPPRPDLMTSGTRPARERPKAR